jgi:hypothetical protein
VRFRRHQVKEAAQLVGIIPSKADMFTDEDLRWVDRLHRFVRILRLIGERDERHRPPILSHLADSNPTVTLASLSLPFTGDVEVVLTNCGDSNVTVQLVGSGWRELMPGDRALYTLHND